MIVYRPIDEVMEFIASSPPKEILAYRPSAFHQERVEYLVYKKKISFLNDNEIAELEQYLHIEHIVIMAKKKAKKQLAE